MSNHAGYDRYEFINAIVGWLGTDKLYMEVLKCDAVTLANLVRDEESEEFEDRLFLALNNMSTAELNNLSDKYNLDCIVIDN